MPRRSARPPVQLHQLRRDVPVEEMIEDLLDTTSVALADDDLSPTCIIRIYYRGKNNHSRKKAKLITQHILEAFQKDHA